MKAWHKDGQFEIDLPVLTLEQVIALKEWLRVQTVSDFEDSNAAVAAYRIYCALSDLNLEGRRDADVPTIP